MIGPKKSEAYLWPFHQLEITHSGKLQAQVLKSFRCLVDNLFQGKYMMMTILVYKQMEFCNSILCCSLLCP
jgi:hypothetical protein